MQVSTYIRKTLYMDLSKYLVVNKCQTEIDTALHIQHIIKNQEVKQ